MITIHSYGHSFIFYDENRRNIRRPGFIAFLSGRDVDKFLGEKM